MGARSVLLLLSVMALLVPGAARGTGDAPVMTPIPSDARYVVVAAVTWGGPIELRLDRHTGRTWLIDEKTEFWDPIPCERYEAPTGDRPRFMIAAAGHSLLLMDTTTGRTWRYDRSPLQAVQDFEWANVPVGKTIEGWHFIP